MATVLNQTGTTAVLGIRDRAILETFYSTGIRRLELIHLGLYDIDLDRGTLMVRQGKGKRDRMLPIGERAVAWVEKYLNEVRPELATAQSWPPPRANRPCSSPTWAHCSTPIG